MKKIVKLFSCIFAFIGVIILASCSGSGIVGELSIESRRTELEVTAEFDEHKLLGDASVNMTVKLYDEEEVYQTVQSLTFSDGVYTVGTCTFSSLDYNSTYIVKLFANVEGEEELLDTETVKTISAGETEEDAIEITTATELKNMGSDGSACYKLMADIDLDGASITTFTSSKAFTGVFDGNGHTISNFSVTGSYSGLFGYCSEATIKNLTVKDVKYKSSSAKPRLGALVGYCEYTTIENCNVENFSVELTPSSSIGTDRISIGGLAGEVLNSTIKNSKTTGVYYVLKKCRNKSAIGLFAGTLSGSTAVEGCSAQGTAAIVMNTTSTGAYLYFGGFAGYVSASNGIKSSYSDCILDLSAVQTVSYDLVVGGFAGTSNNGIANISDCFAVNNFKITAASKEATETTAAEIYKIATNATIGGFMGKVGKALVGINNCYVLNNKDGITVSAKNEDIVVSNLFGDTTSVADGKINNVYSYNDNVTTGDIVAEVINVDSTKVAEVLSADMATALNALVVSE